MVTFAFNFIRITRAQKLQKRPKRVRIIALLGGVGCKDKKANCLGAFQPDTFRQTKKLSRKIPDLERTQA